MLIADVSEPSISSIFIGRWMKYDKGWDVFIPDRVLAGWWRSQWKAID